MRRTGRVGSQSANWRRSTNMAAGGAALAAAAARQRPRPRIMPAPVAVKEPKAELPVPDAEPDRWATIVSLINLKGGVGKTTTTVALAEFVALQHGKRVLVIDLDPQTNATVMLINQYRWKKANEAGHTICQMFVDAIEGTDRFRLDESIIETVSNVGGGIDGLDLLPSSLDLLKVQDRIICASRRGIDPVKLLASHFPDWIRRAYDYVLIDCPPNLGTITLNGIYISDSYLIPVIPDILSTYGITQICDRIRLVSEESIRRPEGEKIRPLGIVVTKFREQSRMHKQTRNDLISRSGLDEEDVRRVPPVFASSIPESTAISEATDVNAEVNTLRQKYSYGKVYDAFRGLTDEFLERTGQAEERI